MSIDELVNHLHILSQSFKCILNTEESRRRVTEMVDAFMLSFVDNGSLYDYSVVCDITNNRPDRIARNELWIDILAKPVPSTEFIYIPIRILN